MQAVQALRPVGMQSKPVRLDSVFDSPEEVLGLVEERAPYVTMAAFHHMEDRLGGPNTQPFFRGVFNDDLLVHNPRWIEAAKKSFSADIVRPLRCSVQLNGPMVATGVHVDLPPFRGLTNADAPVWLMMNMAYSGLFNDWMVPVASGLAWFYRGVGGAFVYWTDVDAPPQIERELWNTGVMSDNEYMFHGVTAIGTDRDRASVKGTISASDTLYPAGGGAWEIRDGGRIVHRLEAEQLRISLLWKAHVFRDEHHLASFEDPSMNLTISTVVDIYRDDLSRHGIEVPRPADPFTDTNWQNLLETTYLQPLSPHAADDIR